MEGSRMTIKSWAEQDRPREKLLLKGKAALSEAELIAILLGSGNKKQTAVELAQHILNHCGNNLNTLARLSTKDLQKFKGIGEAKAISIVSALEIGRRRKNTDPDLKAKIHSSQDAFEFIKSDLMDLNHEEFWIILLKRSNEVILKQMISQGGVSGTVVDAKIIFKKALEEMASGLILIHNHPSGNLQPSNEDIALTKKIQNGGKSLDINLLDHLIVADNSFYSFADENRL
ncbi:MAG: DNA repair protein RadC [Cyclobacteriaceae bacterium]